MVVNTTMVKQLIVTLNTSVYEVPSQSMESCGDYGGEPGQLMLSTGNNNEIIQANSKLWLDQREHDDDEDWAAEYGFDGESTDGGADQESEEEDLLSIGSQSVPTKEVTLTPMQQQHMPNDLTVGPTADRTATPANSGQQQVMTTTPNISVEDRKLLDAMVSSKPVSSLNLTEFSTGRVNKSGNKMQSISQHQNKAALINKQDGNSVVIQEMVQDMPNPVIVGRDTYEEGEEEDILNQYRAEAVRKGDLSPMHRGKRKKTHKREKNWDSKMSEDVNIRRLPMRFAKQKHVYPTTSTKSTRSKKKA
uniref:Uncharacterized protein LOC104247588 n=1 Tax=Nicotiana sylvestris TaxID=4096 RepID=A0A1U7YJ24_NICSY|nr:PREDICTED: uncharacterized protein LOC104247588 [Nicotiana sylvestris]